MESIIADPDQRCVHCPAEVSEEEAHRDSNGDLTCTICYYDGTAYVEPLDFELDHGGGW